MQQANSSQVSNLDSNLSIWLSDKEIFIQKLKSNDFEAFKLLYKQYSSALMGSILRMVDEEKSADSILEETFTQVWISISTYDQSKVMMFTWLNQIAKRCCNTKS
ncbi:sigma factor [Pedobacter mucosus]|uniref:sigma factor n=1 Tax=Pedobacter mucosus TaxID=2895286 RepID=UPI001EE3FC4E|nr:sigma factor [Pedobacter mucosus]UKT64456.1 hypothetical protein LOK61_01455 [Pedobacter mucosus]